MAAIAGQIVEPAGNLLRAGVESASTLLRQGAATVTYTMGGVVFNDVIPADGTHNVAAQFGSGAPIDITRDAYVTFIVCALGGQAQLSCTPERNWSVVALAANVVPLDFVHATGVQRYQLSSGGGAGGGGGAGDAGGAAITFVMNGSGLPITPGTKGALVVPFACTITSAYLIADAFSTTTVGVSRMTYATYPTGSSIVGSSPPRLVADDKSLDLVLSGWTTALSAGDVLTFSVTANNNATELSVVLLVARQTALEWVMDGQGAVLEPGIMGSLTVPFPCAITSVTLLADQAGALDIDIWKSDYASYPPNSTSTICGSSPPRITASTQKSQDAALAGWTTDLAVGDILVFSVVAATLIARCTVVLTVRRH